MLFRGATRLAAGVQGKYPVSSELYLYWKKKKDIPGGMIIHSVSQFQQKVVWQYIWSFPERWFWRLNGFTNNMALPFLLFYGWMAKTAYDAEEYIRNKNWY
jgi:hypothetical protein